MADAAKAIENLLKENNAKLLRSSKNLVYEIPGLKENFVMSKPKSRDGGHVTKNALSHLRRLLKTKEPTTPSTINSAFHSAGLKSSTEQRREVLTKMYAVRTISTKARAAAPVVVEPETPAALAIDLEKTREANLAKWSAGRRVQQPRHSKDAPPVRHATKEEIEQANLKLRDEEKEQPKPAWIPPVPFKMVGDVMIVEGPSITFKPKAEEECWMNTTFVKQNIATWRAQAAQKKAEAEELMARATKLDDEQRALLDAATNAEKFVESLEANGALLEKRPESKTTIITDHKDRLPRGLLASTVVSILEESSAPLSCGELKKKLEAKVNRVVPHQHIYRVVDQVGNKITKLPELGYWLTGRALPGYAFGTAAARTASA